MCLNTQFRQDGKHVNQGLCHWADRRNQYVSLLTPKVGLPQIMVTTSHTPPPTLSTISQTNSYGILLLADLSSVLEKRGIPSSGETDQVEIGLMQPSPGRVAEDIQGLEIKGYCSMTQTRALCLLTGGIRTTGHRAAPPPLPVGVWQRPPVAACHRKGRQDCYETGSFFPTLSTEAKRRGGRVKRDECNEE